MAEDALTAVANELYALPPAGFTAARNARAKEHRDTNRDLAERITALRKPAPAAWVTNALARSHISEIEDALKVGAQMRQATDGLDRPALSKLGKQRRELVSALVKQGAALARVAGHPATPAVLDEVTQTLQAAMTDAAAADALRTGRLLRPLSAVGFEPVDLDGAVAGEVAPSAPEKRAARPEPAERRRTLERAAGVAERAAREADVRLAELREHVDELAAQRSELELTLRSLQAHVQSTGAELDRVDGDIRSLGRDRDAAQRAATAAHRAADRARERARERASD